MNKIINVFHSGEIGDLICSFPFLISLNCPVNIYLNRRFGLKHRYNPIRIIPFLKELFLRQPFINDLKLYNNEIIDYNLDDFRKVGDKLGWKQPSIHRYYFYQWGKEFKPVRFLFNIEPKIMDRDIIIARTTRYLNLAFPHRQIVQRYGNRIAFIGYPEEYEFYKKLFDPEHKTKYYPIKTLYESAQIISGSKLLISNATVFLHIGQGLEHPRIFEASNDPPGVWATGYYNEQDNMFRNTDIENPEIILDKIEEILYNK